MLVKLVLGGESEIRHDFIALFLHIQAPNGIAKLLRGVWLVRWL